MQPIITGATFPILEIALDPGERVAAETGGLAWMTADIEMSTAIQRPGAHGFIGAIVRAFGGGGVFITDFIARSAPGTVAFAAKAPGVIIPVEVKLGRAVLVHRHGFLCGTEGVVVGAGFPRRLARACSVVWVS